MSKQDMIDLITAYDGLHELESAIEVICGRDNMPADYEAGAYGKLCQIFNVIERNTALDSKGHDDYCVSPLADILEDRRLTPAERADFLLSAV